MALLTLLTKSLSNSGLSPENRTDKYSVAAARSKPSQGSTGHRWLRISNNFKNSGVRCLATTITSALLICLGSLIFGLLSASKLLADSAVLGLDPGFQSGVARQARSEKRFFSDFPTGDVEYQLIAVAEQGDLQDSRPFEIVDLGTRSKEDYLQQSSDNVSPFYFGWGNSLGTNTSTLEIDTSARPYFYRNDERLSSPAGKQSTTFRDLPRTLYHSIPANQNDPGLPQLKNSLDDHVHLAMFEQDSASRQQTITALSDLNYQFRLQISETELSHETNYRVGGSGQRVLKNNIGSRVLASILWSEDVDADGQNEVYLVEINLGGRSNLPAWQSGDLCAADSDSHAHLISGQYLVLGADQLLGGASFPLPDNQVIDLTINWGDVLEQLRSRGPDQPCHLEASLQHVENSIAAGVAIEGRGALRQRVEVAAVTLSSGPLSVEEPAVQTQTVGIQDRSLAPVDIAGSGSNCLQPDLLPAGFYRFGGEVIYVNDPFRDADAAAFCRMPGDQPDTSNSPNSAAELCGLPVNRRDDGACNSLVVSEPLSEFFDAAVDFTATADTVTEKTDTSVEGFNNPATELSLLGAPIVAPGRLLLPAGPQWWQVLSAADWTDACPSVNDSAAVSPTDSSISAQASSAYKSCAVAPGRYSAINHTANQRWDDLLVVEDVEVLPSSLSHASVGGRQVLYGLPADAGLLEIQESPISAPDPDSDEKWFRLVWDQAGWYQVTDAASYESICESATHCDLGEGVYTIIDLHTGRRSENVILLD